MKDKIMFVRTKDNRIIKIDENGCIKEFNLLGKKRLFAFRDKRWSYRFENGNEVIKASENLEELFDEVVIVNREKKGIIFHADMFFQTPQETRGKCECYGAIWTEKGLIYVAKMTDKGEWELC